MNIDKRLEEARITSWADYWADSKATSWAAYRASSWAACRVASEAASETAYWASRYEECSYEVQVEILKYLLDNEK
jgi:hypothetical protein